MGSQAWAFTVMPHKKWGWCACRDAEKGSRHFRGPDHRLFTETAWPSDSQANGPWICELQRHVVGTGREWWGWGLREAKAEMMSTHCRVDLDNVRLLLVLILILGRSVGTCSLRCWLCLLKSGRKVSIVMWKDLPPD